MKKNLLIILIIYFFLVLNVNFLYTQDTPKPPEIPKDPNAPFKTSKDIINFFQGILKDFAIIFWIFAIGASFYAGYLYLFAVGVEEKAKKAKKMLLYTIIAIVIGLMAYSLPTLVNNVLKSSPK